MINVKKAFPIALTAKNIFFKITQKNKITYGNLNVSFIIIEMADS